MEFSRPEYWSGLPFPSPADLPDPGIEPRSPALREDSLPAEPPGNLKNSGVGRLSLLQQIFLTQELSRGLLLWKPSHVRQLQGMFFLCTSWIAFIHSAQYVLSRFSQAWLSAIPWAIAREAPPFMAYTLQNSRGGCRDLLQGILPDAGIKPVSPPSPVLQAGTLPLNQRGSRYYSRKSYYSFILNPALYLVQAAMRNIWVKQSQG